MNTVILKLEHAMMVVACLCITLMMLVVCIDAVGRYGFGEPLSWSNDLVVNYLMVGATYFALASTYKHGDHINVNLIHEKLPVKVRALADILCNLLAVAIFSFIAYGASGYAIEAYKQHEFTPGYIMWPVWLSYLPIPLGSALLVLRLLHHSVTLAFSGGDPNVEEHGLVGGAE